MNRTESRGKHRETQQHATGRICVGCLDMKRNEAIEYLTRCADDNGNHWYQGRVWSDPETCPTCHGTNNAGWLHCPGSRYGRNSEQCAFEAYQLAHVWSREDSSEITRERLDYAMELVVNDSDVPERDIAQYIVEGIAGADIDAIVEGYLTCQLWAQHDNDGLDEYGNSPTLDDNYGREDIAPEYVDKVREELLGLVTDHPLAVRMYLARNAGRSRQESLLSTGALISSAEVNTLFGHDFYLTREGHGAGFWDRGLGELGEYLTKIAKAYGSAEELFDNGEGVLS